MKLTIVNGLGCTIGGATVILSRFIRSTPKDNSLYVYLIPILARNFAYVKHLNTPSGKKVFLVGLRHDLFGVPLRPLTELTIGILGCCPFVSRIINLSNYGFAFRSNYALYIHAPFLLQECPGSSLSNSGRIYRSIKRIMLNTCLLQCSTIAVQTEVMKDLVLCYAEHKKIKINGKIFVMMPPVHLDFPTGWTSKPFKNKSTFRLFYPASDFAHKNVELAISAVNSFRQPNIRVTLDVTSKCSRPSSPVIKILPLQDRGTILKLYNQYHALLFTSSHETLGLPLLEAVHRALPIVAPNLPYARVILDDAGCYFNEFNEDSINAAILGLISDYTRWVQAVRHRSLELSSMSVSWSRQWQILLGI
jgi:glycosyltransferase involved in cell wall biosynthesis